jgi:hypothetical protein
MAAFVSAEPDLTEPDLTELGLEFEPTIGDADDPSGTEYFAC